MVSRSTILLPALLLLLAVLGLSCSGKSDGPSDGPSGAAAVEASATRAPAPTFAPEPTQPGPARLSSSIAGSCRITATGAEIRVEYTVMAFGSAQLQRVRLLQDGREVEDSGPLEQRRYVRVATFKVEPGDQHTYRIAAEAPGASQASVQSTVRCGTVPTPSPGPRA